MLAVGGFDVELSAPPHFIEMAACWNGTHSVQFRDECLRQLKVFGVGFGVCHSEFIITDSSTRVGGGQLSQYRRWTRVST